MNEWLSAIVQRFLPTADAIRWVTPIGLAYTLLVFSFAGWLRLRRNVRTAYTRKIVHFLIFTMATVIQLIWRLPGVVVFGSVAAATVLFAVWRGDGHPFYEAMARPSDAPRRTLFILLPLLMTVMGGAVSNVFFGGFAYVGYMVCGWGDAVGEPVGSRWGRHPYRVPSLSGIPASRTLEGSLAVLVAGATAALVGLVVSGFPLATAAPIGIACGVAGALVEAISNHGIDNATTQIAASWVAWLLLG